MPAGDTWGQEDQEPQLVWQTDSWCCRRTAGVAGPSGEGEEKVRKEQAQDQVPQTLTDHGPLLSWGDREPREGLSRSMGGT